MLDIFPPHFCLFIFRWLLLVYLEVQLHSSKHTIAHAWGGILVSVLLFIMWVCVFQEKTEKFNSIFLFSGADGRRVLQFTGLWQGIDVSRWSYICVWLCCVCISDVLFHISADIEPFDRPWLLPSTFCPIHNSQHFHSAMYNGWKSFKSCSHPVSENKITFDVYLIKHVPN